MCDPVSMLVTTAAVQAGGSIMQGRSAQKQANAAAADDIYQASIERDNAQAEAFNIRRAGARQRGETLAGVVASGIKIGEGSALDAERRVMEDYARDEYMALLTGERRGAAFEREAANKRRAGRDAMRGSIINAGTSLLSAGGNYMKAINWNGGNILRG